MEHTGVYLAPFHWCSSLSLLGRDPHSPTPIILQFIFPYTPVIHRHLFPMNKTPNNTSPHNLLFLMSWLNFSIQISANSLCTHTQQMSAQPPPLVPRKPSGVRVMPTPREQPPPGGLPSYTNFPKGTSCFCVWTEWVSYHICCVKVVFLSCNCCSFACSWWLAGHLCGWENSCLSWTNCTTDFVLPLLPQWMVPVGSQIMYRWQMQRERW